MEPEKVGATESGQQPRQRRVRFKASWMREPIETVIVDKAGATQPPQGMVVIAMPGEQRYLYVHPEELEEIAE